MSSGYSLFTKRTNYPKLGYLIFRLKAEDIKCRFRKDGSFHADHVLEVESYRLDDANKILSETGWNSSNGTLDEVDDDDPYFESYADELPDLVEED